jgi:hypothetical protein
MTGDDHPPAEADGKRPRRPFTHRHPLMLILVLLLIVLQLAFATIIAYQASRLIDLGQRIEQLERDRTPRSTPDKE